MKRCPDCGRDYNDDSLSFCLDDGSELLFGPGGTDEAATAIFHSSEAPSDQKTAAQIHTTQRTEIWPSANSGVADARRSQLWRIVPAAFLVVAALGGFLGYRYFSSRTRPIASIAVMPLINASGNADVEYLSDGMTETLINSLSQLPSITVKSRSAVFRYKGTDFDPMQVGAELNAEAVLNGRVLQRGDTITLSLDLVDASSGNQIWGEQYSRKVSDLLLLQKDVARDVAHKLSTKLTGADEQNVGKSYTVDPEAYQFYLQGRYQWNMRTTDGIERAREYFQRAIDKDPRYALAYVGLADSYRVIDDLPPAEAAPKAKAAGLKALELDPALGEAHAVLASVAFYYEWDWPTAEREYKRAIELSPNYPTAHHWFGETLSALGRFDESFAEYRRATELDPVSPAISSDLGWAYYNARQFDRAIEHLKSLIELDPTFVRSYFYLAMVYEETGKLREAIEMRRTGLLKSGRDAVRVEASAARLRTALATSGEAGYWKTTLELTSEVSTRDGITTNPIDMAVIYAHLEERDKAFEWIEKAFRERQSGLPLLNTDPTWDSLRGDPRFAELVLRVGIPKG